MKNNLNLLIKSKEYKETIDKTYMFLKTNQELKHYIETNKYAKLDDKETKIATQQYEIVDYLHKSENNYWLNTGSLTQFLKDK